jgi:hypothetical protein
VLLRVKLNIVSDRRPIADLAANELFAAPSDRRPTHGHPSIRPRTLFSGLRGGLTNNLELSCTDDRSRKESVFVREL